MAAIAGDRQRLAGQRLWVIPTSGGTNVLAIYKGFQELNQLGWVKGMPAIDIVQIAECAPVVRAWKSGEPVVLSIRDLVVEFATS